MQRVPGLASPRRIALIIGVGSYPSRSGLPSLAADNDTARISSVLSNDGWIVYLLNTYEELRNQPNRQNILRTLGIDDSPSGVTYGASDRPYLGKGSLTDSDTLLFFYGGHGWTGPSGVDYILPRDFEKLQNGDFDDKTLISLNAIETALRATDAGSIIIVTDACRTTGAVARNAPSIPVWTRSATASPTRGEVFNNVGEVQHVFSLRSSSPGQVSYEMKEHSSGVFSYYFWTALSPDGLRQASNGKCLTLAALFDFTRSNTVNYVQAQLHQSQQPYIDTNDLQWPKEFCVAEPVTPSLPSLPSSKSPNGVSMTAGSQSAFDQCIAGYVQKCIYDCVVNYHLKESVCEARMCAYDDRKSKKSPAPGLNYQLWTRACSPTLR